MLNTIFLQNSRGELKNEVNICFLSKKVDFSIFLLITS